MRAASYTCSGDGKQFLLDLWEVVGGLFRGGCGLGQSKSYLPVCTDSCICICGPRCMFSRDTAVLASWAGILVVFSRSPSLVHGQDWQGMQ